MGDIESGNLLKKGGSLEGPEGTRSFKVKNQRGVISTFSSGLVNESETNLRLSTTEDDENITAAFGKFVTGILSLFSIFCIILNKFWDIGRKWVYFVTGGCCGTGRITCCEWCVDDLEIGCCCDWCNRHAQKTQLQRMYPDWSRREVNNKVGDIMELEKEEQKAMWIELRNNSKQSV